MVFFGATDKGRKRKNNEDRFACCRPADNVVVLVVCDGMGGEKGGTINGLPEGLTPRNIPSVSDYEWTFLWPLDNEDADNAAEPVEATVSER